MSDDAPHNPSEPIRQAEVQGSVESGCGRRIIVGCLWVVGIVMVAVALLFGTCFLMVH